MGAKRRATFLACSVALGASVASLAGVVAEKARDGSSITLYRTRMAPGSQYAGYSYANFSGADFRDFAVTVEQRKIKLKRGMNTVRLAGMPATLDRATVSLRSKTDPKGTKILEQRLIFDLRSTDKLLSRAKGQEIQVATKDQTVTGKLLAFEHKSITIKTNDKKFPYRIISRAGIVDIRLANNSALVTTPTLQWKIKAERAGTHDFELGYRAHAIRWSADYTAVFDPETSKVDLSAFATIRNDSGADYKGAKVRLVHRRMDVTNSGYGIVATVDSSSTGTRRFDLRRSVDSPSGERVQLDLFPPISARTANPVLVYEPIVGATYSGYPNTDCYAYSTQPTNKTSYRYLEIDPGSTLANQTFPPGEARVFRKTKEGALELVSEEAIALDAGAKKLRIKVGTANNISAMRKQLDCRHDERARELREKIDLTIKNDSGKAVELVVRANMVRWPTWTIESESEKGTQSGRRTQEYRLKIKAKGQKSLTYAVKYSW